MLYYFDFETKIYEGKTGEPVFLNDKEAIPHNATKEKPPATIDNQVAYFNAANHNWEIKDNILGLWYEIETKAERMINSVLADTKGLTRDKPFEFSIWNGKKWILDTGAKAAFDKEKRISEAQSLLDASDYRMFSDKFSQYSTTEQKAILSYREALREVIRGNSTKMPILEI